MKKNYIFEGSIYKSIFMISIPIILGNLLQTVYQLIDTFWVGRLGETAVAAVSLSNPILFLLFSLGMGFTMAGSILVAQFNGKKDEKMVSFVAGQTFTIALILSVFLSILGFFSSDFLLSSMSSDIAVLEPASQYLKILFLGMPSVFVFLVFQSVLRGVGSVKLPMFLVLGTVLLNIILDPLFLFGYGFIPSMGVAGVAWATFITEMLSAVVGISILYFKKFPVRPKLKDFRLQKKWIQKIFQLGWPTSLEHSARSIGMVCMMFLVSPFGSTAVAAFGIGGRMLMFVIIPAVGFSIATSTLVGNNLGANQIQRAKEISFAGIKIGFIVLSLLGGVFFVGAEKIITFFIPGEVEVIRLGTEFLKIIVFSFGFIGVQMAILGTLKAAGMTKLSLFVALCQTAMNLLVAIFVSKGLGLGIFGIWISYPLANFAAMGLAFYFYFRKDWAQRFE